MPYKAHVGSDDANQLTSLRIVAMVSYSSINAAIAFLLTRIVVHPDMPMNETLAINGGSPTRSVPFPTIDPPPPADDEYPLQVFESEIAAFLGGERVAIACGTYSEAVVFASLVAGIDGHEILVPALSVESSTKALLSAGLRPVPTDVDPETGNLATRNLTDAAGTQTGAIFVTHTFGHPAAISELTDLAANSNLVVIEDISESLGARHLGTSVGGFGEVSVLGLGPGHLLTGGEGSEGGIVFVNVDRAEEVRHDRTVNGSAPSDLSVRIALSELRTARRSLETRQVAAWHLTYELRGIRGLLPMSHSRWIRHGYDRYAVRLSSILWRSSLDDTVSALRAEGIPCGPAFVSPNYEIADIRSALGNDDPRLDVRNFVTASQLSSELLEIPLGGATTTDMNDVAAAFIKVAMDSKRGVGEGRLQSE